MRVVLFLVIVLLANGLVNGQVKWDAGGGDGQWGNGLNWTGDQVPLAVDDVVLDNSLVNGNYQLSLPPGNVSTVVHMIRISPAFGNTITLVNPISNTSATSFLATGDGDAVILDEGAVFVNSSGAAAGTPVSVTANNFFRINNGGRYVHNTERGHTNELVSRLSTAVGTEHGVFEFDVPSTAAYTVSASGRNFGTLIFSSASAGANKTYTASGISPFTIRGDLWLKSRVLLSYGANTSSINIAGNCTIENAATFNISNGMNSSRVTVGGNLQNDGLITETGSSTNSVWEFSGSSPQLLSGAGQIINTITLAINNVAGVSLGASMHVKHKLAFLNGKLSSTGANALIVEDGAQCLGAHDGSFVEGPVHKIGNDAFEFPVGAGAIYSPIAISAAGTDADEFIAEYIRSNPQSVAGLGNITEDPIEHISYVEYWSLQRAAGNSDRFVRLFASPSSFAKSLSTLLVASYSTGSWKSKGAMDLITGPLSPPYETGSLSSSIPIEEFTAFAIATTDSEIENPLPLRFLSFNTQARGSAIQLHWALAMQPSAKTIFQVERAGEDGFFQTIGIVHAGTETEYDYKDWLAPRGKLSYRIKIIEPGFGSYYSGIRQRTLEETNEPRLMAYCLRGETLELRIFSGATKTVEIVVLDLLGRIVRRCKQQIEKGIGRYSIPVSRLPKGMYLLAMNAECRWLPAVKIIK